MSGRQRKTFTLEFEDTEPIEGRLRAESGPSREFVGWLGLAAALESVLAPLPGDELDGTGGTPGTAHGGAAG
ncbi:MAG TPA: hypothetical protein VEK39_01570 [Solirubrobacterales bacterium]|nr:hypothetical protein [Solirubrobacterales bacterium]